MIALVTGYIAQYPVAGMTFHYVQYLLGLRALGWDVVYLEDTGRWPYNPREQTFTEDATDNVRYLGRAMARFGLSDAWCLRDNGGRLHGPLAPRLASVIGRADVLLNVSGSCWLRDEYRVVPLSIYVDTDPGYTQYKLTRVDSGDGGPALAGEVELIRQHDVHASYGEAIGSLACSIPDASISWIPTRQPIHLDLWPVEVHRGRCLFTTVLSWEPYSEPFLADGRSFWGKASEIERIVDLPSATGAELELAVSGEAPRTALESHGWRVRSAGPISGSTDAYGDYIRASGAEFSVAKDMYVRTNSGWFSERSACYLASGRPAVVQNTGFGRWLPTGRGLHAFDDAEGAAGAVRRVVSNYADECRAARDIAETYFDARHVLADLLVAAGVGSRVTT